MDLEAFISEASVSAKSSGATDKAAQTSTGTHLRSIVSSLHTAGLNDDVDKICIEKLGIIPSPSLVGSTTYDATFHAPLPVILTFTHSVPDQRPFLPIIARKTLGASLQMSRLHERYQSSPLFES